MRKISFERGKIPFLVGGMSELHGYTLSDIVGKVCDTCGEGKKVR